MPIYRIWRKAVQLWHESLAVLNTLNLFSLFVSRKRISQTETKVESKDTNLIMLGGPVQTCTSNRPLSTRNFEPKAIYHMAKSKRSNLRTVDSVPMINHSSIFNDQKADDPPLSKSLRLNVWTFSDFLLNSYMWSLNNKRNQTYKGLFSEVNKHIPPPKRMPLGPAIADGPLANIIRVTKTGGKLKTRPE